MTTKNIFVVRLEHWALLGLSLLVKVAVSYGHEARVEGLQRSATSAGWLRDLSFVGVQCLHLGYVISQLFVVRIGKASV